jgi:hypothetical protein
MYSISLHEYLHQTETPVTIRTRRTGIENPPRTTLQSSTERKDEVQEEPKQKRKDEVQGESKKNVWISKTVKRAKDRDQRMTARSKLKQRLTY